MRISTAAGVSAVAAAALAISLTGATAGTAAPVARQAIALTSTGSLVSFSVADPARLTTIGMPEGLAGDTGLIGIDRRVQDGKLYGVGNQGGVYRLQGKVATKVSQLTVELSGTEFGVDFNPAADRLRVISDTGQNLRHDVTGGTTIVDGTLNYPTPPNPAPAASGVSAAAYTNNDLDATTATTLFDIDTVLDQVVLQSPANSGQLAATGKLGIDAESVAGFDIVSTLTGTRTTGNVAYASLSVSGQRALYKIDLLTGAATKVGNFTQGTRLIRDIAVALK